MSFSADCSSRETLKKRREENKKKEIKLIRTVIKIN